MKDTFGAGHEEAGAACLAAVGLVAGSWHTIVVVARHELLLVDPQFAVEEMRSEERRVGIECVAGWWREAHKNADPVSFDVGREQLALDPGRDLFPFRLGPLLLRSQQG